MRALLDLTGSKYGTFRVMSRFGAVGSTSRWVCVCDCGCFRVLYGQHLREGQSKCSCQNRSRHPLYSTWQNMLARCCSPKNHAYANYGGRGITVIDRWHDFELFAQDMGVRPPFTSLDRIDNDQGYSPNNCKWSTPEEQMNNTRRTRHLTFNGVTMSAAKWASALGITRQAMSLRLNLEYSDERLFHKGSLIMQATATSGV